VNAINNYTFTLTNKLQVITQEITTPNKPDWRRWSSDDTANWTLYLKKNVTVPINETIVPNNGTPATTGTPVAFTPPEHPTINQPTVNTTSVPLVAPVPWWYWPVIIIGGIVALLCVGWLVLIYGPWPKEKKK
jgi:hypothetical protein